MSVIHHFSGDTSEGEYAWEGVQPVSINIDEVQGVFKRVLVGPDENTPNFIIRYFQVPVDSKTFNHQHPHEHGMLILHGSAIIQLGESFHELKALDSVFVSGDDLHQVINTGEESLGFLCIIPSDAKET